MSPLSSECYDSLMKKDIIAMTRKQFRRYQVIQETIDGHLTVSEAAEALGLSTRQIKRLKKGVKLDDAAAIIHGNTGKVPANALSKETVETILNLKRDALFKECNFCHFREILEERYSISVSYTFLYRLLTESGIFSPKKRRRYRPHRRRKRNPQPGLLVQTDATPFPWFKGDRKRYALHGAIDDATGQILALYMTKNECLKGYFSMTRLMIENFGIPVSLYADRHTIFQSPMAGKADIDSRAPINDTQYGRALKELDIQLIPARSPQAKGRIERLWETLQSRLPVEFSLKGIKDIDSANRFLKNYIYQYNSQFAVEPEDTHSLFRKSDRDLIHILCLKEQRVVDAGGVFTYHGSSYKVFDSPEAPALHKGAKVTVLVGDPFGMLVESKGVYYDVLPFVPPKRKKAVIENKSKRKPIPSPPPANHPWNQDPKPWVAGERWKDIRNMLEKML